jgi:hypothetical protein
MRSFVFNRIQYWNIFSRARDRLQAGTREIIVTINFKCIHDKIFWVCRGKTRRTVRSQTLAEAL